MNPERDTDERAPRDPPPVDVPNTDVPDTAASPEVEPLVDYAGTARRIRRSVIVVASLVVVGWLVVGLATGGPDAEGLGLAVVVGLAVLFVVEVVVVGGSALRGMLRAGERGERLAGDDVAIVPPQLRRRGKRQ